MPEQSFHHLSFSYEHAKAWLLCCSFLLIYMSQKLGPLASSPRTPIKYLLLQLSSLPLATHSHAVFKQAVQTNHLLTRRALRPHPLLLTRDRCSNHKSHHHSTSSCPLQELQTFNYTKAKHNGSPPELQQHRPILRPQVQHLGPVQVSLQTTKRGGTASLTLTTSAESNAAAATL